MNILVKKFHRRIWVFLGSEVYVQGPLRIYDHVFGVDTLYEFLIGTYIIRSKDNICKIETHGAEPFKNILVKQITLNKNIISFEGGEKVFYIFGWSDGRSTFLFE